MEKLSEKIEAEYDQKHDDEHRSELFHFPGFANVLEAREYVYFFVRGGMQGLLKTDRQQNDIDKS